MDQAVEDGTGGVVLGGLAVSLLHLSEDLGFPHHHGVQAGGHPEEVLHRVPVPVDVKGLLQVVRGNLGVAGKKLPEVGGGLIRGRGDADHLDPVAGGVEEALGDFGPAFQVVIGAPHVGDEADQLFPKGHRCGFVVDAAEQEVHGF